jgi:hypothetical protein
MILLSCSKDMRRAPNESINFAPAAPDAAKLRRLFRRLCRAGTEPMREESSRQVLTEPKVRRRARASP